MHDSSTRAGRWPLALTVAAIVTLGACSHDDQPLTAPSRSPNKPSLAVGDVITVTNARGTAEPGTLRWAVAQATGGEIIRFDPGLAGATITLDTTLVVTSYLTIEGPADKGVTISGGGKGRVMDMPALTPGLPATKLRNLSITGGNLASGGGGAGVRTYRPLTIEHSTLWGNVATGSPAVLALNEGPLTVVNSTVSNNVSTAGYEAITSGKLVVIDNSTIAYNSHGAIWFNDVAGGTLRNSIVANNGAWNCTTIANVSYWGTNLSNDKSCGDSTVMLVADPKLDSLRDNGGPGMTHAVPRESPAFNALPGGCAVTVDQRYKPRDANCDIGAFEATDATIATITIDRLASLTGGNAVVTGTVKCNRGGDQLVLQVTVQQRGPDKAVTQGTVGVNVSCTTAAQAWSAQVVPSVGTFRTGPASATAVTGLTPDGVAPGGASRSIKLVAPAA